MKTTTAADGVAKGGAIGIVVYLCNRYNVDPAITALAMPLVAAVLALASTKIGDPNIASFFGTSEKK
jgi:hypothetical protein